MKLVVFTIIGRSNPAICHVISIFRRIMQLVNYISYTSYRGQLNNCCLWAFLVSVELLVMFML